MEMRLVVAIIGGGAALISALLLLILKSMNQNIVKLEETTSKRLERHDDIISRLRVDLSDLKSSFRDKAAGDRNDLYSQIEDVEEKLHSFQTSTLSSYPTKAECQKQVDDLKSRIIALESAVKEVDSVTREQSLLLARIDQAVRNL